MEAAIDQMEADDEVWVGVLQANTEGQANPVFCAGADLKAINSGNAGGLGTKRGGFAGYVYRERKKPVIVAVDGLATAGGFEIVLASDLVVATTRSAFGLAEVKRNLVAAGGGLYRLPRAIGQAAATEVILTGEPLSAERAYAFGLVSRLVEPGEATNAAFELAEKITAAAPMAVWASRRVILASADSDEAALRKLSDEEFAARRAVRGHQRGPRSVHREAPAELEGSLTPPLQRLGSELAIRGDQTGDDARPLVEVLGLTVAGQRLALDGAPRHVRGPRRWPPPTGRRRSPARGPTA